MITHVVLFRFESKKRAAEAADKLRGMVGVVASLQELEVGLDFAGTERSWDLALITRFTDRNALKAYQSDPAHLEVVAFIKAHSTGAAVVDYES